MPTSGHTAVPLKCLAVHGSTLQTQCMQFPLFAPTSKSSVECLRIGNFHQRWDFWFWSRKERKMHYDVLCKARNLRTSFLLLSTIEIWSLRILHWGRGGVCHVHCRIFRSITGLYLVAPSLLVTTKKCLQALSNVSLGNKITPGWEMQL